MTGRKRRPGRPRRFKKRYWLLASLVVVVGLGALLQNSRNRSATRRYEMPGVRTDLGTHRLHSFLVGNSGPLVILESGLGGESYTWGPIQKTLSSRARVFCYDRAGYGWSDVGPPPRSNLQAVKELRLLLEKRGLKPPYLLVGHSMGGLNMRLFACMYPDDVSGLCLVDAYNRDLFEEDTDVGEMTFVVKAGHALRHLGAPVLMVPGFVRQALASATPEAKKLELIGQWQEIYEQSVRAKGRVGNSIGGLTFQWSDGWWKYRRTENLDIHDTNASWPNGGYPDDFVEGENNMNEEWWGICRQGAAATHQGLRGLPARGLLRAAGGVHARSLRPGHDDLRRSARTSAHQRRWDAVLEARGDRAALPANLVEKMSLSGLRMEFETFSTGGRTSPRRRPRRPQEMRCPSFLGFDHSQSFFVDFEAKPSEAVVGRPVD